MRRLAPFLLISMLGACASTESSSGGAGDSTVTGAPVEQPSTAAPETETAASEPPSSEPAGTEPPANEPLPTEPPVTELPVTEPPVTEPPATGPATERIAVFYGGSGPQAPWVPLGWWDGAAWNAIAVSDDFTLVPPPSPEIGSVAVTSLDLPDGTAAVVSGLSLGPEQAYCIDDEVGPLIPDAPVIPDTPLSLGYDAVAVTADWPLQPRAVRQIGPDNPEYSTIGASFFAGTPTAAEGSVAQAVRVDLDGDGVEEVLVTYERITEPDFGAENDFSGIYVRYPSADGTVVDEALVSYVADAPVDFPTVGRFTVAAIADLNGDGVMEVMVRERFWESGGMSVHALEQGRLVRVGGGGCGV